jgi:hypothetical protein
MTPLSLDLNTRIPVQDIGRSIFDTLADDSLRERFAIREEERRKSMAFAVVADVTRPIDKVIDTPPAPPSVPGVSLVKVQRPAVNANTTIEGKIVTVPVRSRHRRVKTTRLGGLIKWCSATWRVVSVRAGLWTVEKKKIDA